MLFKLAAPLMFATCLASTAMVQPATARPAFLIHGNYCGPGNNAPLPPIDALDAACARHDACTPDDLLPTKSCNLRLEREAAEIANDPRQPNDLRSMAGFISMGASMMLSKADPEPTARIMTARTLPRRADRAPRWARLSTHGTRGGVR